MIGNGPNAKQILSSQDGAVAEHRNSPPARSFRQSELTGKT
jgi:hypothetical protein